LVKIAGTTAEESAINRLMLAGFYEQNNLLIDAGTAYVQAIQLAPDVPQYKEDYIAFLTRNGMKKASKK
jgi:cytochrome c-type biogenesis protein CcmH/NrfG